MDGRRVLMQTSPQLYKSFDTNSSPLFSSSSKFWFEKKFSFLGSLGLIRTDTSQKKRDGWSVDLGWKWEFAVTSCVNLSLKYVVY